MGRGSWNYDDWKSYSSKRIHGRSTTGIYGAKGMPRKFDPYQVIRESCDSPDHPDSTPIILGLDVTGSMSGILQVMAEKLGDLITEIYKRRPVTDPQVLFAAIGDSTCDHSPLQVTQFESDIRIASQLTEVYFERGGGGNRFESYPLAWYFAANKTKCDNYIKRKKKGFLFTFGDDGLPTHLTKEEIEDIFGDTVPQHIPLDQLAAQVNRQYEVFHFCMAQGGSHQHIDYRKWQEVIGERAILIQDYTKIPEIIVSILETYSGKEKEEIIRSWDGDTSVAVAEALSTLSPAKKAKKGLIQF